MEKFKVANQSNDEENHAITVAVLNEVTAILVDYFREDIESLESEEEVNQYLTTLWDISCVAMASTGMQIIGKNSENYYISLFNPTVII